jgi:hypothetical protein
LVLTLAIVSQPVAAHVPTAAWCVDHPQRVGMCHRVRGRLTAYNGNPTFRIWVVGSNRLLGVMGRDWRETEAGDMLPPHVRSALGSRPFETRVFGDFEICPLTRERPGWMQMVCIASAPRLVASRR